jgi:hypothetical protein
MGFDTVPCGLFGDPNEMKLRRVGTNLARAFHLVHSIALIKIYKHVLCLLELIILQLGSWARWWARSPLVYPSGSKPSGFGTIKPGTSTCLPFGALYTSSTYT